MANTYTQIHLHIVFAVKHRQALIAPAWREALEKYMTAIVQKYAHKLLAIYAMPDHVHLLIGYRVTHLLPDLVEELKTGTNHWIKQMQFTNMPFAWQIGYGAFAHAKSQLPHVIQYILNQPTHHTRYTFRDEYLAILKSNEIP